MRGGQQMGLYDQLRRRAQPPAGTACCVVRPAACLRSPTSSSSIFEFLVASEGAPSTRSNPPYPQTCSCAHCLRVAGVCQPLRLNTPRTPLSQTRALAPVPRIIIGLAAASSGIGLRASSAAANHWLASAGRLFASGCPPLRESMAAPAGYMYGTRGGRLTGLKLIGIVSGGLVESTSLRCAEPRGTPWDPTHSLWHVAGVATAAAAERARVARTLHARRRRRQRRAQPHSRPASLDRGTPRVRPREPEHTDHAARSLLARAQVPQNQDRGRQVRWAKRRQASGGRRRRRCLHFQIFFVHVPCSDQAFVS